MEHFDTYSAHPAVHTIDTMSICMKIVGAKNHFLYEIDSFSCLYHNSSFTDLATMSPATSALCTGSTQEDPSLYN